MVFHPEAESELQALCDDIAGRASPSIVWNFVVGVRDHCLGLSTFPQRGTERLEIMPVESEQVLILGGRNITLELFEGRL
ncbi:MAG: type II toxin-antitoxin system RelE/ParE family toxin [Mesorhizobium sp.]|nr:MAG: type II toxin-antitoxin system RelE/ParE family toxin [Mesorhizobium sp.]